MPPRLPDALRTPLRLAWAVRAFLGFAWENELARRAPRVHEWTKRRAGATGRGDGLDGAAGARYFRAVADDYEAVARACGLAAGAGELYRRRRVLELGPGDTRAVGLLSVLRGAASWDGLDAFDIESRDAGYQRAIYEHLARAEAAPPDRIDAALGRTRMIREAAPGAGYDLVLSRAVLEHVRDLEALYAGLRPALADDAVIIHKVNLRCHGLRFDHELDFLLFPERAYRRMASHLDLPNRVRAGAYLALGERHGLATLHAATTHLLPAGAAPLARPRLAPAFARCADAELRVLGLWLVQVGPAHPLAARAAPLRVEDLGPAPEGLSAC